MEIVKKQQIYLELTDILGVKYWYSSLFKQSSKIKLKDAFKSESLRNVAIKQIKDLGGDPSEFKGI